MFERFTTQAREVVQTALTEAKSLGASRIGAEHLLIGIAATRSGPARDTLAAAGLDTERLRDLASRGPSGAAGSGKLDADALATLGIDLDQVRRAAEAAFGPGALDRRAGRGRGTTARLAPEAKGAFGRALRLAHAHGDREITAAHLLGGLINQGDNGAVRLLTAGGVDLAALRADLIRRMTAAA